MPTRERKQQYFGRMEKMLDTYRKILIVTADHVGSQQFHQIRKALRGVGVVLMGKNTMMRKVIQNFVKKNQDHPVEVMIPYVKGNIGLIFTNEDLSLVRKVIEENRVPAAARAGVIAECDVVVPPGPTGCDPGQTAWFQALNVPTKISKGQIEIVSELKLITKGVKVGNSEAALLQKLHIMPFTYGLALQYVYDNGAVFESAVLDITEADLKKKFVTAVTRLAALSLGAGYPTLASIPHSFAAGLKRIIAVSAACGYSFQQMKKWDALLNMDPAELAKLQAAAAASSSGGAAGGGAAAAEEKKKEEAEEEAVNLGGGNLFGDEGGGDAD